MLSLTASSGLPAALRGLTCMAFVADETWSWETLCNAADWPSADSQWQIQLSCCFWAAVLLFCNASADRVLKSEFD